MKKTIAAAVICAIGVGGSATAQEVNLCDGSFMDGNSYNVDAIAEAVSGTWSQVAPGTGWTRGVTQNLARIEQNRVDRNLYVIGEEMTTKLRPIQGATIASGMGRDRLADMHISYTQTGVEDGMTFEEEIDASGEQMLGIYGCDQGRAPMFWWHAGSGAERSNGMLVFLSSRSAIGFMENSAFGTRSVFMYRE